jgi:hypothetical protein
MKFIDILDELEEQFVDYAANDFAARGQIYGILKNPSMKELEDLIKEERPRGFRLITDKKDVYVFNQELLHESALKKIKEEGHNIGRPFFGFGYLNLGLEGYRVGGKDRHELQKELGKITMKKTPFKVIKK